MKILDAKDKPGGSNASAQVISSSAFMESYGMAKKDYVPPSHRDVVIKMQTTAHLPRTLDLLNQPKINTQETTQTGSQGGTTAGQSKTPVKDK